MRKLMWITLGFSFSCALFAYLLPRELWLPVLAAFGAAGLLCALLAGKHGIFRRLGLIFLGGALACLWFSQYYRLY